MSGEAGGTAAPSRPVLAGRAVTLQPGRLGGRFRDGLLMDMLAAELGCGL